MPLETFISRLRSRLSRARFDHELDEEMRQHLELLTARLERDGLDHAEARSKALREFGGLAQLREEARDARGWRALEDLGRDLKIGARALVHSPGFAAVVVLTLGIGVGGSATIFGVVNAILLKPLPYPEAGRVVAVWQHDRKLGVDRQEVAPANFLDWRERSRAFDHLTALEPFGLDWQSREGPVYLPTTLVYEGFFDTFGTPPLAGRGFRADEHTAGRADVVVLGFKVWRTRFGGAADIVGRRLILDDRPHTVVGVMPEGFAIPNDDTVWAPKVIGSWERQSRSSNFYSVYGRVRAGVTIEQAAADLGAVAAQLSREYPRTNSATGVAIVPLPDQIVGRVRAALWLLLGAVGLVLAVVTASVASMQVARAVARGREFAIRAALGAGTARVVRQLAVENLMLAACGAALGFALARVALNGVRAIAPAAVPRITEFHADLRVLLFATGLSCLAVVVTGLVPVFFAVRSRLHSDAARGARVVSGGLLMARAQTALVVFQFCASLVLLVAAGLMVRSFVSILSQDRGFRTDGVVAVTIQSWGYYPKPSERARFVREVEADLAGLPGARSVGTTSSVPLMETIGAEQSPLTIAGAPPLAPGENAPLVNFAVTTPGLFHALAIPLRTGRLFSAIDDLDAAPVVLVNDSFVRRYLAGSHPLGARILLANLRGGVQQPPLYREIVGVVGDVRRSALHEASRPAVYLPHAQLPVGANAFIVWSDLQPAEVIRQVKQAVWRRNPAIPVYRETTLGELVGASLQQRRFLLTVLSGFATMALALAAAGIFGLLSFITAQRSREFAVRLALGAARNGVIALVLKRGLLLASIGIAVGLLAALATGRLLTGMLYNVTPFDPATFAVAASVLAATALLASFFPAWRAARTDPIESLRDD